ncbi:filamentous hemagglutinin N-terminal domain-containing protein [Campylobacter lari]|uniref:filamentous hemagglutinin N-terminal domain-containing protein n=1 Tax=Campylobacter lari TaxID=201 RepID=UPI001816A326|nr:filamentous hemagglutinin N-terminal domain-containing protein [Campylobacter lari]EAJ6178182.1 filamentous hemagglutinin N-terminal domain-containing protein [Campylobacter lari]ECP5281006.1 filamentous hemagglutinin N-terminal domain-containing protein [Campylobacter lari]EGK8079830.1 filamentous hemagglutinin N-terminal domain-containing protein [Campylobacter lari]MCV3435568.1 filamentous hemagglutinin N-terminal domain-containing protein [Campylobacter lari]
MKKLANHIILSGVTVSMLFSPLMALPSGGKFTHGTSGTITTNGNNMNISGNGINSVIQWGGGFNIANGEKVNFGGKDKNYLNIAHGTSKSTIAGILNAGGNNVFLINPNGVIITKTGTINANRFVASTSSISDGDMKAFANLKSFEDGLSFSPVFKPNKAGNVVNMGTINAKNVTLQGNKVMLSADTSWDDKNNKIKFNQITADNIDLKGNEIYVDISTINSKNLTTEAKNKGIAYLSATGYYYNPTRKYNEFKNINNTIKKTYNQYISIGSDVDWWHFAKGWSENEDFRNNVAEDTFKLTNDIDFGANCKNGVCSGQNYANYWVDLNGDGKKDANEYTNMMVGRGEFFTKTFDGQGFTLKNINIDITNWGSVGIFASASSGANFKNINVDYMGGGINAKGTRWVGGFIGTSYMRFGPSFSNISLNKIGSINSGGSVGPVGGFAGSAYNNTFSNISLNEIGNISGNSNFKYAFSSIGGFVGESMDSTFSNISLNKIGNISGNSETNTIYVGGFVGYANEKNNFSDIIIKKIENISSISNNCSHSGGFAGGGLMGGKFERIFLENIANINSTSKSKSAYAGGFIGNNISYYTTYYNEKFIFDVNNISLKGVSNITSKAENAYAGGFAGFFIEKRKVEDYDGSKNGYSYKINLKNIYMYFDEDAKITANNNKNNFTGKFYGGMEDIKEIAFDNIHIYYKKDTLTNATADDKYLNKQDFNKNANNVNKINAYAYSDSNKEQAYEDFINHVNTISKPIFPIIPPSKPSQNTDYIPNAEDVINKTAVLDENDLLKEMIENEIIADITNGKYKLHISDLLKMLEDKANYSNMSENQKIEFIAKYFLSGDKTKALKVVQSLDFLLAYENNGLSTASEDKFEGNGFGVKNEILSQVNNTTENIKGKFDQLKELEPLVNSSNKYLKDLITKQNELDNAIKAYNTYVDLINKGFASADDREFIILKDQINTLMKESQVLADSINENQGKLIDWQNNNNTENFKVVGAFANVILNTNPKLDQITGKGGDIDNPNKPELPETDMEFEQTASLNLIGDNAIEDNEGKKEIEETSLAQKNKTCIVSDNYKTMNPCVVGM